MSYIGRNDGEQSAMGVDGEHFTVGLVTTLTPSGKKVPMTGTVGGAANVNIVSGGSSITTTRVNSSALEASKVIKASAGTLWDIVVYNNKASTQYIQLFDSATVPADTAVPVMTFPVATLTTVGISFQQGMTFSTGIAISNSSTAATKTIGSADCFFTANYV